MQNEILNERLSYAFNVLDLNRKILPLIENQEYNKVRAIISAKSDYINDEINRYRNISNNRQSGIPHDHITKLINMSQVYSELEDYFIEKTIENVK